MKASKTLLLQSGFFQPACSRPGREVSPESPSPPAQPGAPPCTAAMSPSLGPAVPPLAIAHRSAPAPPHRGEYKLVSTEAYGGEECSAVNFGDGYYTNPATSTSPFQRLQIRYKLLLNDNGNFSPFTKPPILASLLE